jgi:hypothetical protein
LKTLEVRRDVPGTALPAIQCGMLRGAVVEAVEALESTAVDIGLTSIPSL